MLLAVLVVGLAAAVTLGLLASLTGPEGRVEVGVVTGVESVSLTEVRAFTLRTADGRTVRLEVGRLENAAEFPPAHLAEHRATGQPVRVSYRLAGDVPVAFRLEDAAAP